MLEKPGAFMLAPVYQLLFGKNKSWEPSLELTENQIAISYETYKTDKADDRQAIVDGNLTPGNSLNNFLYAQVIHGDRIS